MSEKIELMIVDDEAIVGKRLKPSLEKKGYSVEVFRDGEGAIERLKEKHFDIVITDIRMERIDGMQMLEHIVVHRPQTKVILITGYATVELAREALLKGAFDFIAKPFKPSDLYGVLKKATRNLESRVGQGEA